MSDDDKIIRFPGAAAMPHATDKSTRKARSAKAAGAETPSAEQLQAAMQAAVGLSEDQQKAMGIIMSGMPFVIVGIKPTDKGADFFTAVDGDAADLRNAQPHLAGVIDRLFDRRGL